MVQTVTLALFNSIRYMTWTNKILLPWNAINLLGLHAFQLKRYWTEFSVSSKMVTNSEQKNSYQSNCPISCFIWNPCTSCGRFTLSWFQTSLQLAAPPFHRLITACRFWVAALSGHAALAFDRAASLQSWIEVNCLRSAAVGKAARILIDW